MTAWADVIASAMVLIDDVRLEEQLAVSPAQFYRRMVGWVNLAYPKLCRPRELLDYIRSGKVEPEYDDYLWTSTEASTRDETVLATGKTGYDICSVTIRVEHPNNTVSLLPYSGAVYDPETGNVTFQQQTEAGINYDLDFYKDGEFPTLTDKQMELAAYAIATLWDERFARNWIGMAPKLHDENFDAPNEPQYMEKSDKRLRENIVAFNDKLRDYEQMCAYNTVFRRGNSNIVLV